MSLGLHPACVTAEQKTAHIKTLATKSREKFDEEKRIEAEREHWPFLRKELFMIVRSHRFEGICGMIILFNMVIVVVETDASVADGVTPLWAEVSTTLLLLIYTAELTSKLYVYRWRFFHEMWNVLDFIIVGVDLVFVMVALIVDQMPSVSILRVFRLVRLARAFKAAKSFKELNSLLRACTCALKAIFWGMVMLFMSLTVWGILAVQLIHPVNKEIVETKPHLYTDAGCERCPRAYSTVFDSMLTFWKQLVAGDSWGTLCEPIIEEAPWTAIFFMLVLVTVNLTMLNCILAVVVEAGAAAAAADEHDKAMERQKMVFQAEGRLIDFCQGLDSDDSGSLSIDEFLKGYRDDKGFRECLELMHVTQSDMYMIFNICDEDDSGDVDYREFVEQLRRIKHSGDQLLLHYVTDIRHQVNKIRPECLKAPKKAMDTSADGPPHQVVEEKQIEIEGSIPKQNVKDDTGLAAAAVSSEDDLDFSDALQDIFNKDEKEKVEAKAESQRRENSDPDSTIDDFLRREKIRLEKVVEQINTSLSAIMGDLVLQSKAQTQLLNTLVDGFNNGGGLSSRESGRGGSLASPQSALRDTDRVRLAQPVAAPALVSARDQPLDTGTCGCVRIV